VFIMGLSSIVIVQGSMRFWRKPDAGDACHAAGLIDGVYKRWGCLQLCNLHQCCPSSKGLPLEGA
jgi:hypothetical protein